MPAMTRIARNAMWFGLLAAFTSSVGQTFFIGQFGADLRAALNLSEAALGSLYATATLASGALMFWIGELADRRALRQAITIALLLLAAGAALLGWAGHVLVVWLGLFLLRIGGQGLTGHLAIVAAARYAGAQRRGRGVATTSLGFILGEGLLPFATVAALLWCTWQQVWWGVAGLVLLVAIPGLRALARPLPDPSFPELSPDAKTHADTGKSGVVEPLLDRRRLLRNPAFLAALAFILMSAFVVTAVFFHQTALAGLRGWSTGMLPAAFLLFACCQAASAIASGHAVDRYGAYRLARMYLLPLALAIMILAWIDGPIGLLLGFAGLGITAGAQGVVAGALWVELFGPRQIGLVRGVYVAMMVFATALSPWLLGLALTRGVDLGAVALPMALYAVLAPLLSAGILARTVRNAAAPQ